MKKVLIIGAGPAGLTAGYELMKHTGQYDVTILEEASQVGGISKTVEYNGHRMDMGGHAFRTDNEAVNNWWKEIMQLQGAPALDDAKCGRIVPLKEGGPDPEKEDEVLLVRNRVAHVLYQDKFFDYPIRMSVNTLRNMGIGTSIKAGFDFVGNSVSRKREVNLEHYYLNRFGKQLYKVFFEDYIEKLWGKHPSQIETGVGIQYIKGQSVATVIRENDKNIDDPKFLYPKLGVGQMWEAVANKFEEMGGVIHTNCSVLKINKKNSKIKSLTCAMDGEPIEVETDIVISTMPIKDLIIGMNDVPGNIIDIASHLCYRDFVTVSLLVPKLNINVDSSTKTLGNIIPDTWIYIQDKRRKLARVQIYNNWSPYLVKDPENSVWVGCEFYCEEGDNDWNRSEEEWVRFAKQEMSFLHLISSSTPVLESHKECVRKAYPSYFGSYNRIEDVIQYLDTIPNLYCIGRNGQHKCHDMAYSMMTAFAAVKSIIYNVQNRANVWNVKQGESVSDAPVVTKSYQTSSPVPPKANSYVPPTPVKTPSKPIEVPSAPVIHVNENQKKVTKEVLRGVVAQELKSQKELKEKSEPLTFKAVDKMFDSEDAQKEAATELRISEQRPKKVTTVQELRPTLIVQDAEDAEPEKPVDIVKNREDYEPVKFSVKKHEDIIERPFKEIEFDHDYTGSYLLDAMKKSEEGSEDEDDIAKEAPVSSEVIAVYEEAEEEEKTTETSEENAVDDVAEDDVTEAEVEVTGAESKIVEQEEVTASEEESEVVEAEETEAEESEVVETEVASEEASDDIDETEENVKPEQNVIVKNIADEMKPENEQEKDPSEKAADRRKELHSLIQNMVPANEVMQRQVVKKSKDRAPIPLAKDIERLDSISVSPSVVTAESIDHTALPKETVKRSGMEAVRQFERVLSLEDEPAQETIKADSPVAEDSFETEKEQELLLAEEKRKEEEAEKARLAEEKRKAEEAEKARLAEEKRKEEEAEKARLAEEKRKAEEAEKARLAEEKRKAEEAEKARLAEEKRKEEEAEKARLAEEKRKEREAEKARQEAEKARLAEEKRKEREAEKARQEAEKARLAEEKRKEREAEKARQEAEKARLAEEKRKEREAEKARQEAEKARLAEEKRKEREAEKARQEAEKARLAEEKRKEREAEKARLAEERRKEKEAEKARLAEEKNKAKTASEEKPVRNNKKSSVKEEPAKEEVKTVTVGKITGRVIKTKIVEISPDDPSKRMRR